MSEAVTARSASDKTDDWPYWMIWRDLNVTALIMREMGYDMGGVVFLPRDICEAVVAAYNNGCRDLDEALNTKKANAHE